MSSDFDALLESYTKAGRLDSSGQFTMDRESALRKLAQYRYPYEDAWILKLAQAAVLSGSTFLDIQLTDSATEFRFAAPPSWSTQDFQKIFSCPEWTVEQAFEDLRAGLWSVAVAKHRPFKIHIPGQPEGYLWDGLQLVPQEEPAPEFLELIVSHRARGADHRFSLLQKAQSILINRNIRHVINTGMFTLPLKLTVDGERLDGFQFGCAVPLKAVPVIVRVMLRSGVWQGKKGSVPYWY